MSPYLNTHPNLPSVSSVNPNNSPSQHGHARSQGTNRPTGGDVLIRPGIFGKIGDRLDTAEVCKHSSELLDPEQYDLWTLENHVLQPVDLDHVPELLD